MQGNESNFNRLRNKLKTTLFQAEQTHGQQDNSESPQLTTAVQFLSGGDLQLIQGQTGPCVFASSDQIPSMRKIPPHLTFNVKIFSEFYNLGPLIGEGAHAIVRKCWTLDNSKTYAVKITRSSDVEIMNTMKTTFLNAVSLNHPNIIKHYELFIDQNKEQAFLLMEYSENSSLEQMMKERGRLKYDQAATMLIQILKAIKYVHSRGICHRDIKPDNILINQNDLKIQLIDFGVSKRYIVGEPGKKAGREQMMLTTTGTLLYQAPEIHRFSGYTTAIDIWAIGVVAYQMVCGMLPFNQEQIMEFYDLGQTKQFQYKTEKRFLELPKMIQDFIRRLLHPDPKLRLKAKDALQHPWLNYTKPYSFEKAPQRARDRQKSKDDLDFSKQSYSGWLALKGLANSESFNHFIMNKALETSSTVSIMQEGMELRPLEQSKILQISWKPSLEHSRNLQQSITTFKQNTRIESIHILRRDENSNRQINLVGSYKSQQTNSGSLSAFQQQFQSDPLNLNFDNIKYCDSSSSMVSFEVESTDRVIDHSFKQIKQLEKLEHSAVLHPITEENENVQTPVIRSYKDLV